MARNGWAWPKWLEVTGITGNSWKWLEIAGNRWKWMEMDGNGWK